MSNDWELVVKGGKHKAKLQVSNKELKKINQNNLNANKYRLALDDDTDKSLSPEQDKITTKSKTKKSNPAKSEDDINKQINKINSESIKNIYSELSEKFPNQVTSTLLDLAVHISLMIKTNEEINKTINYDQADFPYAFLSNDTRTVLKTIFSGMSNVNINNFLKSAMIQLLDDHDKGIQSIGLRVLIQVCVKMKSNIFITNRQNFFDLLNMYREQTQKFKLLTWVLKQACSNYNMACQIWLIYFLPFISQRCHTEFVIGFGEEMSDLPVDTTNNDTSLLVTDFLPVIDLIFSQGMDQQNDRRKRKQANFQLHRHQIERLKLIYPKIKDQAFLCKSPGALKDYFASLFLRLSANNRNELLNQELLDCLDYCSKMSPESINQLSHLHLEYPQQTKVFLDHLTSGKSSAASEIKRSKSFKAVMTKIHSTTLAAPQGSVQEDLRLLSKANSGSRVGACLTTLFRVIGYVILIGLLVGGISYVQYPQQFRQVQARLQPYVDEAAQFARPVYDYVETRVMLVHKHTGPFILFAWTEVRAKSQELWTQAKPTVDNVASNIDEVLTYVKIKVNEIFPELLEWTAQMLQSVRRYVEQSVEQVVRYFHSEQFAGLVKAAKDQFGTLYQQAEHGYQWVVNYTLQMIGSS